jgi:hypothetical protein
VRLLRRITDGNSAWYDGDPDRQTSYELTNTTEAWNYRTHTLLNDLREQTELFACSGGVWTQTTDVEGEVNGLMTYDRRECSILSLIILDVFVSTSNTFADVVSSPSGIIRMNETQWKQDVTALYAAAARRASGEAKDFVFMSGQSLGVM